ncbi:gliding motility lipoprotein GldB [Reichenbachiella agarivorans]|uniref:Gliding motility lipoprotein GldB n=1 Tax=Reichenbachiella agarivorans TaxID=2979464 RepID=A0ABY6CTB1_9BACT|nr:gliding motility lipoprotein GldB [Reichenbachiella agarivorans]UXP33574.1 gliding motility lipoprotein GldB [Reichenbachiella agarivorans]
MKIENYSRFIQKTVLLIVVLVSFAACEQNNCDNLSQYESIEVDIEVDHLERSLRSLQSWQETVAFFEAHREVADYFLDANQYPNDTILAKRLFRLMQDPNIDSLFMEVEEYFKDFDSKNVAELQSAYRFIKYQYPETKIPKVQTIITGQYNDLYVSDSLIVIGLDFFMGDHAKYPPNDVPAYIVKRYMRESVAPIVLSFISNEFNHIDSSHGTLLADMVNIGKSYYFVSSALPCKPDSLIMGYTSDEMRLVKGNQEIIWANLIENELLYETNHSIKNKFVGESPNIYEISEKCPGRVGGWVGWQIVKKYMDNNPEVSLQDLMKETDAHKIFQLSGYKPKNVVN